LEKSKVQQYLDWLLENKLEEQAFAAEDLVVFGYNLSVDYPILIYSFIQFSIRFQLFGLVLFIKRLNSKLF